MLRLRSLSYALLAVVILIGAMLWSGVTASTSDGTLAAPQWGLGPGSTIPPTVNLSVDLQRPNSPAASAPWAVPVTLWFYEPGGTTPLYTFNQTLDTSGKWSGALTMNEGSYDVRIRNLHTLTNLKKSVVIGPANNLYMGMLIEGDATADNKVRDGDFTILRAAYFSSEAGAGWDPRADFDEDNKVRSSDFALLSMNYFKTGDIEVAAPLVGNRSASLKNAVAEPGVKAVDSALSPRVGTVGLALVPRLTRVAPGQVFTLTLTALAAQQSFVAADAEIHFPADVLQVVGTDGQPSTSIDVQAPFTELINKVDNDAGTILVGVGTFGPPVSGSAPLAALRFRVLRSAPVDISLVDCTVADQNGKWVTGPLAGARVVPAGYTNLCLPLISAD